MDIMIDIETLGKESDAIIAAVAAVPFDLTRPGVFPESPFVENFEVSAQRGSVDPSTVLWWLGQSKEAIEVTFKKQAQDPRNALIGLSTFIVNCAPQNVWANSPSFDLNILRGAYRKYDLGDTPWQYWQEKDQRTIEYLATLRDRHYKRPDPRDGFNKHDCLEDAMYQAAVVQEAYRVIKAS